MIELRHCPRIASPCAQLPAFAAGQRSAFCSLCQRLVHNLSAMTADQQGALLAREPQACVRYRWVVPALVAALSTSAPAQTGPAEEVVESIVITGGGIDTLTLPLFLQSDLPESFDEAPPAGPATR